MAKGAQPSDRVMRFLDAAGVAKREKRNNPERAIPRKERKAARKQKAQGRGRRQGRSQGQGRRQARERRHAAEAAASRSTACRTPWPTASALPRSAPRTAFAARSGCGRSPQDPMAVDVLRPAGKRGRHAALRDRGAAAGEGSLRRAARRRRRPRRGRAADQPQALRAARPAAADRGRRDVLPRRPGRPCRGDAGRRGARHGDGDPSISAPAIWSRSSRRAAARPLLVPFTDAAVPEIDIDGAAAWSWCRRPMTE